MTTALAIFVKTPRHSPVKTRLAADIGIHAATAFHKMAAHAVAEVAQAAGDDLRPCWAVAEHAAVGDPLWAALPKLWQGEGTLGERLHGVYSTLLQTHARVLLVGADTPQITPPLLQRAIRVLRDEDRDFVLGRACDGGFWLFGGRASIGREIWCKVRYSQSDTTAQLCKALDMREAGTALPALTDVDHAPDLDVLRGALAASLALVPAQRALLDWLRARCDAATT